MRLADLKDPSRCQHVSRYPLPDAAEGGAAIWVDVYVDRTTERAFHVIETKMAYGELASGQLTIDGPWHPLDP